MTRLWMFCCVLSACAGAEQDPSGDGANGGSDAPTDTEVLYATALAPLGAPSTLADQALGVAADGTAYALFQTATDPTGEWLLVKVGPSGEPVRDSAWPMRLSGREDRDVSGLIQAQSAGLGVDPAGDVVIAVAGPDGWTTRRLDPSGETVWQANYFSGEEAYPRGVLVDREGRAIVYGRPGSMVGGEGDCQIIAYGEDGTFEDGYELTLSDADPGLRYCVPGAVDPDSGEAWLGGLVVAGGGAETAYGALRLDDGGGVSATQPPVDLFDLADGAVDLDGLTYPRSALSVRADGVAIAAIAELEYCGNCDWAAHLTGIGPGGERLFVEEWPGETGRMGLDHATGRFAWFSNSQADFGVGAPVELTWLDVDDGGIAVHASVLLESPPEVSSYPLAAASGPVRDVFALIQTTDGPFLWRIAAPTP